MILDGVREVNQNIQRLTQKLNNVTIEFLKMIDMGVIPATYHEDFESFERLSRKFEQLERGSSGLIVNNENVEQFKRLVNHDRRGAELTYINFYTMLAGNKLLGQKSIFEIDTGFCSSKDKFLYMMKRLFEMASTAKVMDGRSIDPVQTETYKKMFLEVLQKHIEACGCPSKSKPEVISNFQLLVSQPSPRTSGLEFYERIIADNSISRTDLQKLNLLYKAKPFDFSPTILPTITSQPFEVFEMIFNLAEFNSLDTLPLMENKLLCTKDLPFTGRLDVAREFAFIIPP